MGLNEFVRVGKGERSTVAVSAELRLVPPREVLLVGGGLEEGGEGLVEGKEDAHVPARVVELELGKGTPLPYLRVLSVLLSHFPFVPTA
jgi:hypothetical protein